MKKLLILLIFLAGCRDKVEITQRVKIHSVIRGIYMVETCVWYNGEDRTLEMMDNAFVPASKIQEVKKAQMIKAKSLSDKLMVIEQ